MTEVVIIPAAGLATRLRPLSNAMSKAMIPVAGKPILGHILSSLKGIADHVIIVHGKNDDIQNFLSGKDYGFKIDAVHQANADGPLGAVKVACDFLDENVIYASASKATIWLGDTLVSSKAEVEAIFNTRGNANLVVAQPVADYSRWCMAKSDGSMITYFDKPSTRPATDLALIGVYRFNDLEMLKREVTQSFDSYKKEDQKELSALLELSRDRTSIGVVQSWLDCGDLPSLHAANAALINGKSRAHNSVSINGQMISKGLQNDNEVSWYKAIQDMYEVRNAVPQFLGTNDNGSFNLELCSGSTLQDMVVYDDIRHDCWPFIINSVVDTYMKAFSGRETFEHTIDPHYMFRWNIMRRFDKIENLPFEAYVFLNESFDLFQTAKITEDDVIHGDFHFGNVIYDASCNKVKLIDPRGEWAGVQTTKGNMLYDIAKFYQSIFAKYAWVVADEPVDEELRKVLIKAIDEAFPFPDYTLHLAKRYSVLLQLSAIPLHYDNPKRQQRMLNTSLELIAEMNA